MANVYNRSKLELLNGDTDVNEGTAGRFRMLLLKSLAFNPDHNVVNDLTPGTNELTVGGYARQNLTSVATAQDDTNDRADAQADQVTFASLTAGETIIAAVVYRHITNDTDSVLLAYYDVADTATNGGDVIIQFDGMDPGDFLRLT